MTAPTNPAGTSSRISGLVASGLAQVALGALVGFPYAVAVHRPELLRGVHVPAPHRIRQLHLDLIMMGGLVTATGVALPQLPRTVTIPLAVGCWTNALAFAPLAIKPSITSSPAFRAAVAASFVTTSLSWVAVAVIAVRRWAGPRRAAGNRKRASRWPVAPQW